VTNKDKIIACLGALLTVSVTAGLWGWHTGNKRSSELESQLKMLQQQEKYSAVDRSISAQMEKIAYQQKAISDEQREEAVEQTRIANEMRQRSEIERQNAVIAERNAVASERKAIEASSIAEQQRQMAEHQRIQAEFSKRVADTLSYVALGRSLGSLSSFQYDAGHIDIADLLAFASYTYTHRYHGDLYQPSVFQALLQSSRSKKSWALHNGMITNIEMIPKQDNKFLTVSTYGEIKVHEQKNDVLESKTILSNKNYDFRDAWIDTTTVFIFALSRTGHLVVIKDESKKIVPVSQILHPTYIKIMRDKRNLLIIGENSVGLFDLVTQQLVDFRQLDFHVIYAHLYDNNPIIFDDQGRMHQVVGLNDFRTEKVPVPGKITAFASSKKTGLVAYGTSDGTLYLVDKNGRSRQLIGHRSRISKIRINGWRVYSSSYDGVLNLWVANSNNVEPMQLFDTNSWMTTFAFDNSKDYVWAGGQDGSITSVLISVPKMVEKMQGKLTRDFTQEEWAYFMGRQVPYESFMNARKGGRE